MYDCTLVVSENKHNETLCQFISLLRSLNSLFLTLKYYLYWSLAKAICLTRWARNLIWCDKGKRPIIGYVILGWNCYQC